MDGAHLVLKFIEAIGRRNEVEYYLKLFQESSQETFALLVIQPSILRMTHDVVALDLKFLFELGLVPAVVVARGRSQDNEGLGRSLEKKLADSSVSTAWIGDPLLREKPEAFDGVRDALNADRIPILVQPEPSAEWIGRVLSELKSRKLIFVRRAGALRKGLHTLPLINLTRGYKDLLHDKEISHADRQVLEAVHTIVTTHARHKVVASVTSPFDLLKELFTTKGAGTLLRKGAHIRVYATWAEAPVARIQAILEQSFDARLMAQFFDRPIANVFLEEDAQGVAIIQSTPMGGYLTKFAVTPQAQGEGLGKDLWDEMLAKYDKVFWRARPQNPIHPWYLNQAHGWLDTTQWRVYWRNLPISEIQEVVEWVITQPSDFERSHATTPCKSPSIT